jgi:DNA-binding MarR family transcriptional regulator
MSDGRQALSRPVGWWLKEADALLDAAFDAALEGCDVDRRGWQVLASLAREPMSRGDVLAALASFDPPDVVHGVLEDLSARGWIEEDRGRLRLTAHGSEQQRVLAPRVDAVRQKVSASLPQDDYLQLVSLLARLVNGLRPAP